MTGLPGLAVRQAWDGEGWLWWRQMYGHATGNAQWAWIELR